LVLEKCWWSSVCGAALMIYSEKENKRHGHDALLYALFFTDIF